MLTATSFEILNRLRLWGPYQWLGGVAGVLALLNVVGAMPAPLTVAGSLTHWMTATHPSWPAEAARWIAERHKIIGQATSWWLLAAALVGARGHNRVTFGGQLGAATALAAWSLMDQVGRGGALAALVAAVVIGAVLATASKWMSGTITTADNREENAGVWLRKSLSLTGIEVFAAFFDCLYPAIVLTFGRVPSERRAVEVYPLPSAFPVRVELVDKPPAPTGAVPT